jgi:hypothetical protein
MSAPTKFRIVLACNGVPPHLGKQGAADITEEFSRRQWHENVRCDWDGSSLILQAENDYDDDGKALMDEFSDLISGFISEPFDGDIIVQSIDKLG